MPKHMKRLKHFCPKGQDKCVRFTRYFDKISEEEWLEILKFNGKHSVLLENKITFKIYAEIEPVHNPGYQEERAVQIKEIFAMTLRQKDNLCKICYM